MKFSVVVPTHNRPELLKEALISIDNQNCDTQHSLEVVVIDDASEPPVELETLKKACRHDIKLFRNNTASGLAYNRDKGVQLATADIIMHLDDDDKLAPEAIKNINAFFIRNPQSETLFLGVEGFGRSEYFQNVQTKALEKILELCNSPQNKDNIFFFNRSLFTALLTTVPMCFQRAAATKNTWMKINDLRLAAYFGNLEQNDRDFFMRQLTGPLRDSEWALYASLISNTALLDKPIYLQRCEGQGMVSQMSMRNKQVQAQINIKKQLLAASLSLPELEEYNSLIKGNLADTFFNQAYYELHTNGKRVEALRFLIKANSLERRFKHTKLLIKLLLPTL